MLEGALRGLVVQLTQGLGCLARAPTLPLLSDLGEAFARARFQRQRIYEAPSWYDVDYAGVSQVAAESDWMSALSGAGNVVWLAVNSTHPSQGDYKKPADMAAWMQQQKAAATHTLIDSEGNYRNEADLTKTGMDYAAYLIAKRQPLAAVGRAAQRH